MRKEKNLYFFFINCNFIVLFLLSPIAADPKIVTTIKKGFESIESWLLKIATPAAAVAVGTGVFMKKFSFGDEEKN